MTKGANGKYTSLEEFERRARNQHGYKYDYSKVIFKTLKDKVVINCPIHGEFKQMPKLHFIQGCKLCGVDKRASQRRFTKEQYIEKASTKHSNRYDYSLTDYKGSEKHIDIACQIHGVFTQNANAHLQGQGCPKCGSIASVDNREYSTGWSYAQWEEAASNSKNFKGFQVYVISCWNSEESFIKIGKTFQDIQARFPTKAELPYSYTILHQEFGDALTISKLENHLHAVYKEYKVIPKIPFNGITECIQNRPKKEIQETIAQYLQTLLPT